MKKNIYYLEDSEVDFSNFSRLLTNSKLSVFPKSDFWSMETNAVKLYLQNSNDANRAILVEIFKKYNVDLFLVDISLFHSNAGGNTIYEDIISTDFSDKPVLFFTYPDTKEKVITSQNVRIEFKSGKNGGQIDYNTSSQRAYDKIKELLSIEDTLIDIINDIY